VPGGIVGLRFNPSASQAASCGVLFEDGITIRMTCHCTSDHLDLARGMKLSRAAYESRRKSPPAIVKARFVEPFSDETIKSYSRTELEGLQPCLPHSRVA
jgi:hypothetical protein